MLKEKRESPPKKRNKKEIPHQARQNCYFPKYFLRTFSQRSLRVSLASYGRDLQSMSVCSLLFFHRLGGFKLVSCLSCLLVFAMCIMSIQKTESWFAVSPEHWQNDIAYVFEEIRVFRGKTFSSALCHRLFIIIWIANLPCFRSVLFGQFCVYQIIVKTAL